MPRYNLSPSTIARYFYHNCERYLRYHATSKRDKRIEGIPIIDPNQNPISKALLQAGINWEEKVVRTYLKDKVRISDEPGPIHERKFGFERSLRIYPELNLGEGIFQPAMTVSDDFPAKFGLSPQLCKFTTCYPDLIHVVQNDNGSPLLQIIDVKANEKLKTSHRVQTALYAIMLKDILAKHNLDLQVDMEQAGIWLYEQDEPELFDLSFNIKVVEDFLRNRLTDILTTPIEDVPWHLYNKCEQCEYYQICKSESQDTRSVSLIPNLSVGGRNYFRDATWAEERKEESVNTLSDLDNFLQNNYADELLDNCGSLRNQGDRLRNTISALSTGDVILHGCVSLALPINENVSLFMTLQSDPISGQVYAAGFRRFKGKDIYDDTSHEVMYVAKSPEKCLDIQFKFLNDLFNELKIIHDYNQNKDWMMQKSLQVYVFDTYEQILFNKLLNESVKEPKLAFISLKLMFHFHSTGLSEMELHPSKKISYPLVVLTKEINTIAGLPIPFVNRLPEVLKAFPAPDFDYELNPSDLFWHEHSNTLKYDAIAMAWSGQKPEAVEWVGSELSRRLVASSSILSGIRAKAKDQLINWAPKFEFYDSTDFKYKKLSKLNFITQYESFTSALAIREKRSLPWKERVREGISIPLENIGNVIENNTLINVFKLVNPIDSSLFEQNETFLSIIAPAGKEGEKAQIAFDDYQYRGTFAPTTKKNISFARIDDKKVDPKDGKVKLIHMDIEYGDEEEHFKPKDIAIIHPRYTDFTSKHVLGRLKEIDEYDDNDFIHLLQDPIGFTTKINENETVRANAMVYAQHASFTDSQKHAFEHILDKRLTLIWGPPGTGKTHLLAKSVLCFAKAKRDQGIQVRIGVTAFTHAAVENILIKIQEFANEDDFGPDLQIYKIGETRTSAGHEKLKSIIESKTYKLNDCPYLVMGSTVYSFNKIKGNTDPFDILIVDEASQMKFGELAVGTSILGCGNRLILAGDDLQLPPIISGDYPDPEDGLPGLHESIFTYLRHRDDKVQPKYTCQLLENWRMNNTLTRFPAETLYGDNFKPATAEIGSQKLKLLPENTDIEISDTEKQFVEMALDPDYPLVVCILENVQASVENIIEAELVAKLTNQIRQRLPQKTANIPYPDDENGDSQFWRHGLFIVSPHHTQISAIKNKLSELREWKYPTFVDTVDKMQGQESEVVIVSYGVSDTETAMNEAEFIYSLNRLNVSITRAKTKCIVFLPRPLIEAHMDILQNEKASKGLNHMLSLVDFCRNNGDQQSFELDSLQQDSEAILTCMRSA